MKVAIPWSADPKKQYGDEYNISFDSEQNNFDTLFDFILKHSTIRFNIVPKKMNLQQMIAIDNIGNIYFKIPSNLKLVKEMKEHGLKFFFNALSAPSSFSLLEEQLMFGVSDVYICDDLCYNLEKVRKACDKYNVQVRLILNEIPSKRLDKGKNPRAPIFIPEYKKKLSNYIDVGEFNASSWIKINTLYKIWFKQEKWREDLKFIYNDLEISIPNESLIPNFFDFKINCGYRCGYGSCCNKCEQFVDIARDLREKNIEYV